MKTTYKTVRYIVFFSLLLFAQPSAAADEDVDFSCMKQQVRPIIQVTDRYQEFDVVVRNWCPGAVYWAMCIERMDPWSYRILENHTPTGYVEAEKKARVNLQMKATPNTGGDRKKAQAFYVNIAFSVEGPPSASCVARKCEIAKKELRAEVARNDRAWENARKAVEAQAMEACPDNGWNSAETRKCRKDFIESAADQTAVFEKTDRDLQARLAEAGPGNCATHGGHTLELKKS